MNRLCAGAWTAWGWRRRWTRCWRARPPRRRRAIINLLAAPRIAESPALTAATLGALTAKSSGAASLDHATVLAVAAEMTAPGVGDGLTRLERSSAGGVDKTALLEIASSDDWRVLDAKAAVATRPQAPQIATRPTLVQPVKVAPALTPTVKPPGQIVTTPVR